MTPNPAERERETTLIQHYRRFRIYLYPTVSLLSFMWIFVLVKDKIPGGGLGVSRQEAQEVIPLVHAC